MAVVPGRELLAGRGVGHGDLERRHVGAADQPLVDLGQLVAQEAKSDVIPLDIRVLRPREQPHQPRAQRAGHLAQLGRGNKVLRMIEDDTHADPLGRVHLHQDALDQLVQEREDRVGVARPRFRLADPLAQEGDHPPQPLGVGPGGNPQPLAQVVPQDDVPGAEKLRRQEVDDAAVAPLLAGLLQRQVVHIAVHHEQAGRAGEILLGKLASPARKPRHDRAGALARQRGRWSRLTG